MNGSFGQPNISQMDSGGGNPGFSADCASYLNDLGIIKCGGNSESFQSANNDLQRIITSPSFPSIFIEIFNNVRDPYILFMTATSMKNLIGKPEDNVIGNFEDLKVFILRYLHDNPNTHTNVISSLCSCFGRIVKVTWLKDLRQRSLLEQLETFFDNSFFMQKVKFEILTEIVIQMNQYIPALESRSIHRSSTVIFYSCLLLPILKECLSVLPTSESQETLVLTPERICLYEVTLRLINACMSYNFMGSSPVDSEEVELLQIPCEWSSTVCQPSIVNTLFAIYTKGPDNLAEICAETILLFIAVRRSLFNTPQDSVSYYYAVLLGLLSVLSNKTHLEDRQCHLFISQCLSKFKTTIQLSELLKYSEFLPFFEQVTSFALDTIEHYGYLGDFSYIIIFWGRIIEALRYTSSPVFSIIPEHVVNEAIQSVCRTFIDTFINRVDDYIENDLDNPLMNLEAITKYEEKIAIIMNYDYSFVFASVQQYLRSYKQQLTVILDQLRKGSPSRDYRKLDACLSWCILLVSMTLKKQMFTDYQIHKENHLIDANFCSLVLSVMELLQFNDQFSLPHLFPSLFTVMPIFLQSFCSILSDYKLKSITSSSKETIEQTGSKKLQAYSTFFSRIGSGDPIIIIDSILLFLLNTLCQGHLSPSIVNQCLSLFTLLCHNPFIQRVIISMGTMKSLVVKHASYHFTSLELQELGRYRTLFYASLTEAMLVCAVPGDLDLFVMSLYNKMSQAVQEQNISVVAFCLRDGTGIVRSCLTSYHFNTVYDILCPAVFSLIHELLPAFWDHSFFVIAAFRFLQEISTNRKCRIDSNDTSTKLVLFFREISSIIQQYMEILSQHYDIGNGNIIRLPSPVIKSIQLIYSILSQILGGCFVPFGAMIFYEDPSLGSLLSILSQSISIINVRDILLLPKLASSLYSYLKDLFTLNPLIVSSLNVDVFNLYMSIVVEGLSSEDEVIVKKAAATIDALASYLYINQKGQLATYTRIQALIPNPDVFWSSVLKQLFDTILLSKVSLQWDLSRPLLSVFLVYENGLNEYCQYLCKGCDEKEVEAIREIFKEMLNVIDRSLDASAREAFSMMVGKWCQLLGKFALNRSQI